MDILFCVTKTGTKTYVPIFRFVAGVNRELICDCHSLFVIIFWLFLINFIVFFFYLFLKYFRYVCRKLILRFVVDENDLHRVCNGKL